MNPSPPMAYPGAMPPMAEPPEASSVRSMLDLARIFALIFLIIGFLAGVAWVGLAIAAWTTCTGIVGNYCGAFAGVLFGPIYILLWGIVNILIYLRAKDIMRLVDQRQYDQAKSATVIWMVLGIIFGLLPGIFLLIAWLKLDPLIQWQRGGYASPPTMGGYYAPPMGSPAPVPAPVAPPVPPAAPIAAPICPRCQKPGTWIAQYQRYYCYTDAQYL